MNEKKPPTIAIIFIAFVIIAFITHCEALNKIPFVSVTDAEVAEYAGT